MVYRLSLFGGFSLEVQGEPCTSFESDKVRALLAYLAAEKDQPHRRDKLVGLLWPDSPEKHARHSLSQALYSLKPLFSNDGHRPCLAVTPQEIRFCSPGCWLDVEEFQALIHACEAHEHRAGWACRTCLEHQERAVSLYRGDFLAGLNLDECVAFDEWLLQKRDGFREQMIRVTGQLASGFDQLGDPETALFYARKQVAFDPINEAHHRQVMQFHARLGQRGAALAQYETCRQVLSEELGIEPETSTGLLYRQILEGFPGPPEAPSVRHNLPASLTPLVGRRDELKNLCLQLTSPACRLVTVFGPGGVGKTRLGLEAGRNLLPAFADGVFMAELDDQQQVTSLASVIAQAVAMPQVSIPMTTGFWPSGMTAQEVQRMLVSYLAEKRLLLILDGCEHWLHEVDLVVHLLRHAPHLTILATSRARLGLAAELIFPVEGLSYPSDAWVEDLERYSAVQLFAEAGRRADPGFHLVAANRQSVVEICRLAQGIPLGIVLAAGWCGMLEPEQIVREIRGSLDFLALKGRDLPDRQRSLRATFDYSLRLLGEIERISFLRLSVFRGAFSSQRAWQVAEVALPTLKILVDHSLLQLARQGRFRIHELLRQYALEKLEVETGENQVIRERHCQVFMTVLADLEPRLKSSEMFTALEEMDPAYPDFLVAWDWAAKNGDISRMENALWALERYQTIRNLLGEGAGLFQKTMGWLEEGGIGSRNLRLWVRLGTALANFFIQQQKDEACRQILDRVESELRAQPGLASGLKRERGLLQIAHGMYYFNTGKGRLKVLKSYQKGLDLLYDSENPQDICLGMTHVAAAHRLIGNHRECLRYTELGLETLGPSGDPVLISYMQCQRGYALMFLGQSEEAMRMVEELISSPTWFIDLDESTSIPGFRGLARYHAGLYEEARPLIEQAVALYDRPENQHRYFFPWILDLIYLATGDYASLRLGPELSAEDRAGLEGTTYQYDVRLNWGMLDLVRQDWAQAELDFQTYLHHLEKVPVFDLMGSPLALLGFNAYRLGDLPLARERLIAALENGVKQGNYMVFCISLSVLALILAEAGQLEQAVELYTAATVHPGAGNARYFYDILGKPIARLAETLPAEKVEAARARGRSITLSQAGEKYLAQLKDPVGLLANLPASLDSGKIEL